MPKQRVGAATLKEKVMELYPKIENVFKRDEKTHKLIEGAWRTEEFEYLQDAMWNWTEKVDGTNIRVEWDGEKVTYGGRTERAQIPAPLVAKLIELFPADKFEGRDPICLYGEGYGAGIQKGGGNYIQNGVDFTLFDVRSGDWWLRRADVMDVAESFGIVGVPELGRGTLKDAVYLVKCNNNSEIDGANRTMEGLVVRPCTQLFNRKGKLIIAKIKCCDF